jgi:hypothetical protein
MYPSCAYLYLLQVASLLCSMPSCRGLYAAGAGSNFGSHIQLVQHSGVGCRPDEISLPVMIISSAAVCITGLAGVCWLPCCGKDYTAVYSVTMLSYTPVLQSCKEFASMLLLQATPACRNCNFAHFSAASFRNRHQPQSRHAMTPRDHNCYCLCFPLVSPAPAAGPRGGVPDQQVCC